VKQLSGLWDMLYKEQEFIFIPVYVYIAEAYIVSDLMTTNLKHDFTPANTECLIISVNVRAWVVMQ
jgi:hypothetical protein